MSEVTIKDIARLCGVGVSTVSRAINDHPDINPTTKKHKEEDAILSAARQKALENETKIIDQAKAEAANIIERANHQAELEMKKAQDEIKKEIITVASMVAGKAVSEKLDIEIQDSLIDDTLKEIGEKTWQS